MVETLTKNQLNASDAYLNSIDPGFTKRFWLGLNYNSSQGDFVWITSNTPLSLSVSKNSLPTPPLSSTYNCVKRDSSSGGPWQEADCSWSQSLYAFCQQSN